MEAHRPEVILEVERNGELIELEAPRGGWALRYSNLTPSPTRWKPKLGSLDDALFTAGRRHSVSGRLKQALSAWNELERRIQDPDTRLWLLYRTAVELASAGRWSESRERFQRGVELSRTPEQKIYFLDGTAKTFEYEDRRREARLWFQRALDLRTTTAPDTLGQAWAHQRVGAMAFLLGELDTASRHFRSAFELRERLAPDSVLVADSAHGLGLVAGARFDLHEAEQYLRRAVGLYRQHMPGSPILAFALESLGGLREIRRDLFGADAVLEEALEIRRRLSPGSLAVASNLIALGRSALVAEDLVRAGAWLEEAEEVLDANGSQGLLRALVYNSLGRLAHLRGEWETAEKLNRAALDIQQRTAPESIDLALSLGSLGEIALQTGRPDVAKDLLIRARDHISARAPDSDTHSICLHQLGRAYLELGDAEAAAGALLESIEILERQTARFGGSSLHRQKYRAHKPELYHDAVAVLLDLNRVSDAFRTLERYRMQELARLSSPDLPARRPGPSNPRSTTLADLQASYDRVLAQLAKAASPREVRSLRRRRHELQDELASFAGLPTPKDSREAMMTVDLDGIRRELDEGTVMLSYVIGDRRSHLFVVHPGGTEVVDLGLRAVELRSKVESWLAVVDPPVRWRLDHLDQLSSELSQKLLEPARPWVSKAQRLVIVPDGPLHILPFGALRWQDDSGPGDSSYLVEHKSIQTVGSGTLYQELSARIQRRRQSKEGCPFAETLVAFGAIDFGDGLRSWQSPQRDATAPGVALTRQFNFFSWGSLPSTRREVQSIGALYPGPKKILTGSKATEGQAKNFLAARVLHFATHGFLDPQSPMDSALVMSAPKPGAPQPGAPQPGAPQPGAPKPGAPKPATQANGLLQAWEISRLELSSELVVLSACQSADGLELGGEGLVGLSQAFLQAGAGSVLASSWKVDDHATADLMIGFHRRLRQGLEPAEALRATQIDFIRQDPGQDRPLSSPYYWAAFQLTGGRSGPIVSRGPDSGC